MTAWISKLKWSRSFLNKGIKRVVSWMLAGFVISHRGNSDSQSIHDGMISISPEVLCLLLERFFEMDYNSQSCFGVSLGRLALIESILD